MNFETPIPHDGKIYAKAEDRARAAGIDLTSNFDVIVFLEKEIDSYRDKIAHMENRIEELHAELYAVRNATTTLEAVQDNATTEIIKTLSDNGYKTITINFYKE